MKLCKDCKHLLIQHGIEACSQHISHFDYINGNHENTFCGSARKDSHLCGPDGNWFDPKEGEEKALMKNFLKIFWPPDETPCRQ